MGLIVILIICSGLTQSINSRLGLNGELERGYAIIRLKVYA